MAITYGVGWNEYVARLMLNTLLVKYIIRLGLLVMNGLYATILLKRTSSTLPTDTTDRLHVSVLDVLCIRRCVEGAGAFSVVHYSLTRWYIVVPSCWKPTCTLPHLVF